MYESTGLKRIFAIFLFWLTGAKQLEHWATGTLAILIGNRSSDATFIFRKDKCRFFGSILSRHFYNTKNQPDEIWAGSFFNNIRH